MEAPLITLARFDWLAQAEMARCRLEACGIETFLPDEFTSSIYWHYARGLGGIRLQVGAEDAEDARAILDEEPIPQEEPVLSSREQRTDRAVRAAVFGILMEPFEFYALWLLLAVFRWKETLSARERRNIKSALVLIGLLGVSMLLAVYESRRHFL